MATSSRTLRSADLEQPARARFQSLSDAETKLLRAAHKGEIAFCGPSERDDDPENNPAKSATWDTDRSIRAELIRWLCLDPGARDRIDPRGIRIHAACITGKLDLSFVVVPFFLNFSHCSLSDDLALRFVEIPSIDLTGTFLSSLNADHATVRGSIFLRNACVQGKVELRGAHIGGNLSCDGGRFHNPAIADAPESGIALNAEGASVARGVLLRYGFTSEGGVRLFGTQIGGNLECDGGRFLNPARADGDESGIALDAEGANVGRSVLLRSGFTAEGRVRLFGAQIGGNLECDGGKFQNPAVANITKSGIALDAQGAKIGGDVRLRNGFIAEGAVRLSGTQIGANLACNRGTIQNPAKADIAESGVALEAAYAKVDGAVYLCQEFTAEGSVGLYDAQIGGNLACDGGTFKNPGVANVARSGMALNAEGARVAGAIYLRDRFTAEGVVRLFATQIGRNLECDNSNFRNPVVEKVAESGTALNAEGAKVAESGTALNAEGAKVTGSVLLRNKFAAEGAVRLYAIEIGGNLVCSDGKFQNPAVEKVAESGMALGAQGAHVAGSVYLHNGFESEGTVSLYSAQIGANLVCDGGKFRNPAMTKVAQSGLALNAEGVRVGRDVYLRKDFTAEGMVRMYGAQIEGNLECQSGEFESLNLMNASAAAILDDEKSWPDSGKLSLDGFVYGRISRGPVVAAKRLDWLARQASFTRQPYRQLAKVLREGGDDRGWRKVCAEMERQTWAKRSWIFRPFGSLLRGTIGYGYFSMRAVWWLLALVIVGQVVYWMGYDAGNMAPTNKEAYDSFVACKGVPGNYEAFHALPYSLENSFPLVKLGVQDKWAPEADGRSNVCQSATWNRGFFSRMAKPAFLRWFRWLQICVGWILATLFVAGVTGVIRKD